MASKSNTRVLTGTALLAALVVIFDYALKFSGLKIPFPWMPMLKFDFTGVPVALSLLLYGLPSAATTSLVALFAIVARSGDWVGASMKFAAEFSTVVGMALGLKLSFGLLHKTNKGSSLVIGVTLRMLVMSLANMFVLPNFYGFPLEITYGMMPLIAAFNIVQGVMTVILSLFLAEAVKRRIGKAF